MIRTVEDCPHRQPIGSEGNGPAAKCRLIEQVTGLFDDPLCRVGREVCAYCCRSRVPSAQEINPVLASLLHHVTARVVASGGLPGCDSRKAVAIQEWAEGQLDDEPGDVDQWPVPEREVERCLYLGDPMGVRVRPTASGRGRVPVYQCHHPNHGETALEECAHCRDWANRSGAVFLPVERVLPRPPRRYGPAVRVWSVGVTTAPRRRPTLEWTLDSLVRAGWERARLFLDSSVTIPQKYGDFPVTYREPKLGAWPNFYLGLAELLMRDPHADAFLMVQDDVVFHDRANLRAYLESFLWPAERPGPISLYCAGPTARAEHGWHRHLEPWFLGANALIFSRDAARQFVTDPAVLAHRWSESGSGLANVDTVVGRWAFQRGTPVHFPTPSLCRHVGQTSTLWAAAKLEGTRRTGPFAGDILSPGLLDHARADFPESAFPCPAEFAPAYAQRVERGRARMRESTAVICGVCRDVRPWLARSAARVERLGQMFRRYHAVFLDAGSVEGTAGFLDAWARQNPVMHFLRARRGHDLSQPSAYREQVRGYVLESLPETDFILVIDLELAGGWSEEGIADSFGWEGWDFVGSHGLLRSPAHFQDGRDGPLFFDTWSFRESGEEEALPQDEIRARVLRRGEPIRPVWSCFGGLGLYRREGWEAGSYSGPGCAHVGFHRRMRERGFHRLFLNPSQITLYDETE